ncbi:E3 ubiquitin/ISG15 ligase TRIM25-like [Hyperolius riggenbachi]|uniref:E3 ubiquitin/ISG15 ligase TRIM25-like n=1 Tax=Hyperolius riggenbachi TaxID=752182 RepID=UPI0035A3140A
MAAADLRKELDCSICLNVYTDPVMLKCGHNFCQVCIDRVLDSQEASGRYSCPECREESRERPALYRNIGFRNILKNFLSTEPEQEEGKVFCTHCVDSPVLAVKSCLLCEASLCDKHLRVHSKSPEHVLCDPTSSLESRKCPIHKKTLEYYCHLDAACICLACRLDGAHRGHQVEMLEEASNKKKNQLRNFEQKLTAKIKDIKKRAQNLQKRQRKAQEKADGETERVTDLFRDLRTQLDDLERRVLGDITKQAEQVSNAFDDTIRQLEVEQDKLSRKKRLIEELCNMTDPLTVLQEPGTGDLCDTEEGDNEGGERLDKHGGDLNVADFQRTLYTGLSDIMSGVKKPISIQESAGILLDVNTSNNHLHISDDRKTISWTPVDQNHPGTAEKFMHHPQVLSSNSFSSGVHCWEVDVRGALYWKVGVCYPSIASPGQVIGH